MVNWSKRPEFNISNVPVWRKRLDWILLAIGVTLTAYNAAYVGIGLYLGEIDHEKERRNFKELDDRVNRMIYGRPLSEISPTLHKLHQSVSLVELAAQIRESQDEKTQQQQQQPESGETTESNTRNTTL